MRKVERSGRNYGIDLLRIVAMFFVVLLHSLSGSGILDSTDPSIVNSGLYNSFWLLEIIAYGAVNIFAMISGYVGYSPKVKTHKFSKIIILWLQTVFWSVIMALIAKYLLSIGVGKRDFAIQMTPLIHNNYWYLTAYFCLFFFLPVIDAAVRVITIKNLKYLLVVILVMTTIGNHIFNIEFFLNSGYSVLWLAILYFVGAALKKCNIGKNLKPYKCVLGIIGLHLLTWFVFLLNKDLTVFGKPIITKYTLISYLSPTIVLSSILYILWFNKMKLPNFMIKIVKFAAPGAFAAYLLNTNKYFYNYGRLWQQPLVGVVDSWKLILTAVAFSMAFFIVSVLVDKIRQLLFYVCRVDKVTVWIETKARIALDKVCSRF